MIEEETEEHVSTQYLTFILQNEKFGVDILRVQEIRGWSEARKIPNLPPFILGVINLRGQVVPVLDLRIRFNCESAQYLPTTVVVVVSLSRGDNNQTVGLVVDAVSDVIDVEDHDFKDSPPMGANVDTRFMSGVVIKDELMTVIIDLDKLLASDEVEKLSEMVPE